MQHFDWRSWSYDDDLSSGNGHEPASLNLARLPALADGMILAQFDPWFGGFGLGPKEVDGRLLVYTVGRYSATGQEQWREVFGLTLDAITRGLFDETEGSFRRGAARRDWGEPQPEKPLAVCAEATLAYLVAYQATGRVSYAEVAARALQYLAGGVARQGADLDNLAAACVAEALGYGLECLGDEYLAPARASLDGLWQRLREGLPAAHCAASLGALLVALRILGERPWLAAAQLATWGLEGVPSSPAEPAEVRRYALGARHLVELALLSGRAECAATAERLLEALVPQAPTGDCGTLAALADGLRALRAWKASRTAGGA
ncbi:MAG: hypothetical protein HY690_10805 [Chloroflexi bacterium]|nr:hypothetical protein [Chloroflexota bacterium]